MQNLLEIRFGNLTVIETNLSFSTFSLQMTGVSPHIQVCHKIISSRKKANFELNRLIPMTSLCFLAIQIMGRKMVYLLLIGCFLPIYTPQIIIDGRHVQKLELQNIEHIQPTHLIMVDLCVFQ